VRIPKGDYDKPEIAPAWLPIEQRNDAGDLVPSKPIIRCRCGRLIGLGLHHVHPDGRVTASFLHPEQPGVAGSTDNQAGCGFHEFLELEGYTGPEFPPRPIVERP
jgi:hypothetical protein